MVIGCNPSVTFGIAGFRFFGLFLLGVGESIEGEGKL